MTTVLYSVLRRHLKATGRYFDARDTSAHPELPGVVEGRVVGWYQNPPPHEDSLLIFTDTEVWVTDGQDSFRIALDDILDYETPASKEEAAGVRVLTRTGPRFLRASGSYGPERQYQDAWALVQVLQVLRKR